MTASLKQADSGGNKSRAAFGVLTQFDLRLTLVWCFPAGSDESQACRSVLRGLRGCQGELPVPGCGALPRRHVERHGLRVLRLQPGSGALPAGRVRPPGVSAGELRSPRRRRQCWNVFSSGHPGNRKLTGYRSITDAMLALQSPPAVTFCRIRRSTDRQLASG